MKIVHVVDSLDPRTGGPAVSVPATAEAQRRMHAQAIIACRKRGAPKGHGAWNDEGFLGFSGDMARQIRRRARWADVVHSHGLWLGCNRAAARAASEFARALVISPRGMLEPWSLQHGRWKKRAAMLMYERTNLRAAAGFHATSEAECESIRSCGLGQPIAMIPNGVDVPEAIAQRERTGPRRALFLSRLHKKKGVAELIAAWKRLAPAGWELVIAGEADNPDYTRELRALAGRSAVAPIRFIGFVEGSEKERAYASAELFVLPTWSENFGIVIAEALAHGLPVITTSATPWKVIEDVGAGWIIDPGPASGVAVGLEQALSQALSRSPGELETMGARGRDHVRGSLSWQRTARDLLEFYHWLANPRGEPPPFVR